MHYIPLYLYQVQVMGVAEVQKSHLFQSWLNDDDNVDDSWLLLICTCLLFVNQILFFLDLYYIHFLENFSEMADYRNAAEHCRLLYQDRRINDCK